jgi:hypothetical protein
MLVRGFSAAAGYYWRWWGCWQITDEVWRIFSMDADGVLHSCKLNNRYSSISNSVRQEYGVLTFWTTQVFIRHRNNNFCSFCYLLLFHIIILPFICLLYLFLLIFITFPPPPLWTSLLPRNPQSEQSASQLRFGLGTTRIKVRRFHPWNNLNRFITVTFYCTSYPWGLLSVRRFSFHLLCPDRIWMAI